MPPKKTICHQFLLLPMRLVLVLFDDVWIATHSTWFEVGLWSAHWIHSRGADVRWILLLWCCVLFHLCSLQRLIHHELIFRLLLKVTVNWPRECNWYPICWRDLFIEILSFIKILKKNRSFHFLIMLVKGWLDHSQKNLRSMVSRLGSSQTLEKWYFIWEANRYILAHDQSRSPTITCKGIPIWSGLWSAQEVRYMSLSMNWSTTGRINHCKWYLIWEATATFLLPKRDIIEHTFFLEWSSHRKRLVIYDVFAYSQ